MNNPLPVKYSQEESPEGMVFHIEEGEFAGVKYLYGTVSINEPNVDDAEAVLKFTYKVIADPSGVAETDEHVVDLQVEMGNILYDIVLGQDDTNMVESIESFEMDSLDTDEFDLL